MQYDVIIIGSGPAGASTALHLAQLAPDIAARTLVLERDSHPRHKLCGGGCVIAVETCLKNLGLDFEEVPKVDASWTHLFFRNIGFKMRMGSYAFRVVRRHEFDAWLASHIVRRGIELQEQTTVTGIRSEPDGIVVETNQGEYRAKVVIGADGAKGTVRKHVAKDAPSQVARVVECYTPLESEQGLGLVKADEAGAEFDCVPNGIQGYAWCFPMMQDGRSMRNFGVYDSGVNPQGKTGGSLRGVLQEYLQRYGHRLEDYELQGHPIRLFRSDAVFAAPRMLLVGDAAGVDGLFGEGISPALGYGPIAAEMIRDSFASGDFSMERYKSRLLNSSLGRSLSRRHWVAKLIYRLQIPWMQQFIWRHCGPLVRWAIRKLVFNWATLDPVAKRPQTSVLSDVTVSTVGAGKVSQAQPLAGPRRDTLRERADAVPQSDEQRGPR